MHGVVFEILVQQPPADKISENQKFLLTPPPNHPHILVHPGPFGGAYHDRHETWVGNAVDAAVTGAQMVAGRDQLRERPGGGQTDGIEAYGKIVWTRRPLLASSPAEALQARPGRGAGFRRATETGQRMTPG